jgi:hypothetical protein
VWTKSACFQGTGPLHRTYVRVREWGALGLCAATGTTDIPNPGQAQGHAKMLVGRGLYNKSAGSCLENVLKGKPRGDA